MNKPADFLDLPLLDRAQMAMKAAVEKVIQQHAREDMPLYIWRNGRVMAVSAKRLQQGNGQGQK